MPKCLSESEIVERLAAVPGWFREGKEIVRTFRRSGFVGAIDFVNRIAALAEQADHHPDIDIRWDRVRLALSTHSAGCLTSLDFDLAEDIDRAAAE